MKNQPGFQRHSLETRLTSETWRLREHQVGLTVVMKHFECNTVHYDCHQMVSLWKVLYFSQIFSSPVETNCGIFLGFSLFPWRWTRQTVNTPSAACQHWLMSDARSLSSVLFCFLNCTLTATHANHLHTCTLCTHVHTRPPTQWQLERHSFGSAPWKEAQRRTERQQPSARTGSLLFNVQSRSTCKVSTPLQLDPEIIASAQVNQRNRGVNGGPAMGRLLSEVRGRDGLFEVNVELSFSLKRNHLSSMIGLNWSNDPFVMKIYNYHLSLNLRNYLPNMHILWKDCNCIFLWCAIRRLLLFGTVTQHKPTFCFPLLTRWGAFQCTNLHVNVFDLHVATYDIIQNTKKEVNPIKKTIE